MRTFSLLLQSATRHERFDDAASFVGTDASGSFGLLPGHARMLTCLRPGLARFRTADGRWRFVAQPGAVLYFVDDVLSIATRRYLLDDDHRRIVSAWADELLAEEGRLRTVTESLSRLEDEMLKRLWTLQRASGSAT